jgi:hypothetical protein
LQWEDLSDSHQIEVSPSAVSWGPNRIDLFAVWDKQVHHRASQDGTWGPWTENLDGGTSDGLASASFKPNRVDVFVRDLPASAGASANMSNRHWEKDVFYADGEPWSPWKNLSGDLLGAPAAVASSANRIECFARGAGEHLWHASYDGTDHSAWTELDTLVIKDAPAVVSAPTADRGRVDVFIRDPNDILKHRVYYAAQPTAPRTYVVKPGDYLAKIAREQGVDLATLKALNPQVKPPLYIIHPGDVLKLSEGGMTGPSGWEAGVGWDDIGADKISSAPAAVAWWSANILKRIDCFAQDENNNLMHTWWT